MVFNSNPWEESSDSKQFGKQENAKKKLLLTTYDPASRHVRVTHTVWALASIHRHGSVFIGLKLSGSSNSVLSQSPFNKKMKNLQSIRLGFEAPIQYKQSLMVSPQTTMETCPCLLFTRWKRLQPIGMRTVEMNPQQRMELTLSAPCELQKRPVLAWTKTD